MDRDPIAEKILAAGLSSFGSVGFKATTLSKVASVAGISRPTLYARYPDKRNLFRAVIEQAYLDSLADAMSTARSDGPFSEVLSQVLLDYYGGLFDRFHGLPQIDELVLMQLEYAQDIVAGARRRMKRLLTKLLRDQVKQIGIGVEELDVPIPQLVEILRMTPLSLKRMETTRAQYQTGLRSLAKVISASVKANVG